MNVFVMIPAYNAEQTIERVVKRIPAPFDTNVLVVDDGSSDGTFRAADALPNVTALRHEVNQGYGGAQVTLYRAALERGADVMCMLHADGGHHPEELPRVVSPVLEGVAEIVAGSRMLGILQGGRARSLRGLRNGHRSIMPDHIFFANLVLTKIQNLSYGMTLQSFHEGYRACTRRVLQKVPFESFENGYLYDTEFLVAAHDAGLRIHEVPVSAHYEAGPSALRKNIRYGAGIVRHALRYRFLKRRVTGSTASLSVESE